MTATNYCNTQDVLDYLGYTVEVPNYDNGSTSLEVIGTGNNSETTFFLDHTRVIDATYTIKKGASESVVTSLIENTHYTLDKDRGKIVLLSAGVTALGTANLYGTYKYNSVVKDSVLNDLIERKTSLMEDIMHQTWRTPVQRVREEQPGRGAYQRGYKPSNSPVVVVKQQFSVALTATGSTATLYDVTGLEVDDYITAHHEVMQVTGINGLDVGVSRGEMGTSGEAHDVDEWLVNVVFEVSSSPKGYTPVWYVKRFRSEFDVDSDMGTIQLLHVESGDKSDLASDVYPLMRTFNRVRITYKYGAVEVPADITQCCVLMVCKDLFQSQVLNALGRGTNGFTSESIAMIDKEIQRVINNNSRLFIDGY